MSIFTLFILIIILVIFLICIGIRRLCIKKLNYAINNNNSEDLKKYLNQKKTILFVTEYVRDFYQAKAYLMEKDKVNLETHLRSMFQKEYSMHDQQQYLTFYYHLCMQEEEYAFALEILERIKQTKITSFIQYCVWTKEVMIDHRTDLIEPMEQCIENKEYYGFPLAVITFLVGMQNLFLGQKTEALEWIETARTVFIPNDIYIGKVESLKEKLYDEVMTAKEKKAEV